MNLLRRFESTHGIRLLQIGIPSRGLVTPHSIARHDVVHQPGTGSKIMAVVASNNMIGRDMVVIASDDMGGGGVTFVADDDMIGEDVAVVAIALPHPISHPTPSTRTAQAR